MNPCAASGRIDPKQVTRPKGTKPYKGNHQALQDEGRALWNDPKLSSGGSLSCATCHQDGTAMLQPSFAKPYPHFVQMAADSASMKSITLEEMVQLCMVKPMQATPLAWDSRQLAALTAYTAKLQKSFKPVAGAHNPCAAKNPCAARNPCSAGGTCAAKRH
ncbi:MAG: cytochrome c peroxidase [Nitrosomonadaceae bacterium]|nr:cytochrome c peroxidase [Nitrosomonadaceae bacterium]